MGEVFVEILLSLDGMHNALNGQWACMSCMVTFVLDTAQMDLNIHEPEPETQEPESMDPNISEVLVSTVDILDNVGVWIVNSSTKTDKHLIEIKLSMSIWLDFRF